jgi:hypothetical protein
VAEETWQRVTQHVVSAVPEGMSLDGWAWDVTVEWRGEGLWAVTQHGRCLGADGEWDYERQPSSRTEAWKRTHRFTEQEALRLAHEVAPTICINGLRPADLIARHASRKKVRP